MFELLEEIGPNPKVSSGFEGRTSGLEEDLKFLTILLNFLIMSLFDLRANSIAAKFNATPTILNAKDAI